MSQYQDFTKIDLSKIVAIARDNFRLQVLVETGMGYRLKNIAAPYQAFDGLQKLSRLVSPSENFQSTTKSTDQLLTEIEMFPIVSSTVAAISYCSLLEVLQVDFIEGDRASLL